MADVNPEPEDGTGRTSQVDIWSVVAAFIMEA